MVPCTKCRQAIQTGRTFIDSRFGRWHPACVAQAAQEHHYIFGVERLMTTNLRHSIETRIGLYRQRNIPGDVHAIQTDDPELGPRERQPVDRLPLGHEASSENE